jgi:hypothetical protein
MGIADPGIVHLIAVSGIALMLTTTLSWIAVGLLLFTSVGLLINRDWRIALGLMAAQYVGMFWLVQQHWPLSMAAAKMVTGWMAIATIGITYQNRPLDTEYREQAWPEGRLFRLFAAGIIAILVLIITPVVPNILPGIGLPEVAGSLILLGMGILHLGITAQPFRVILGLLTVFAGFETIYAALEGSVLVAALLAGINLGLALAGSYLLATPFREEQSE